MVIKFIEHKENHLNNVCEMVREPNPTPYTLPADGQNRDSDKNYKEDTNF